MDSVRIETDDPVTDLKCQDKIRVLTQNGECSIEYYLGDICCLKPENKVDVLLVSAFRENYDPIKGTLIGALRYQLKLNVAEYALNKAEDLREYYSCWVSHPLPEHLPFKRLLCFEQRDNSNKFVEMLKFSSYLKSVSKGFRETDLMQSMVEAAVNWMKAGLPLKQLKIVQYAVFTEEGEVAQSQRGTTKASENSLETPIEYDIYLSCCKEDRDVSKALLDSLKQAKPDIRVVVGSDQKMMKDESWQEEMYETMMKSARVVTVLSPRYLQSAACIEQYNIALCCNRKVHKDLLAPFYVEAVPELPSYMQLVQYVDCLSRDASKISAGCQQLVRMLSSSSANIYSDGYMVEVNPVRYDVFLSYSHSDAAKANQIVECLQEKAHDLRIFFDVQEIKQGKAWQRLLYHSIDGSTIFIAMVSERYLKSAVCNEEYSLALAKFCTKGDPLQLCVLKTEDTLSLPRSTRESPLSVQEQTLPIKLRHFAVTSLIGRRQGRLTSQRIFAEKNTS
ncbi:hypothetical protein BSL78_28650 [Apostichopus japonicus]|uniref:ADP-ribosyl cyclase/cyclic ADP-ribose hydrolase n=1 Tax=Stichopus japonicus TaxID=307972 RepID=A0A2G8JFL0_STIJA|nr:hypothetical protein BSL78_28650 [Apostichopus japonicus]